MLRIVYFYAMMAPSTKERTMAMKKCINILLYAAFFGILAAQRPIQEYSIRPSLVSPNLPLPDLLLQIAFIVVTTALFIWKFGSIRFLVLALLTEDVYTLIALLVRKRRRTPPEEPISG